jgi:hypothetical protein
MRTRRFSWFFFLWSCVRASPPPAQLAEPIPVVPPGCFENQSGSWKHSSDSRFFYEAFDDGGVVALAVFSVPTVDAGRPVRRFSRDGGLPWLLSVGDSGVDHELVPDAGPAPIAHLLLQRTPLGFVGVATPGVDGSCSFPTRVIACEPGTLTLETLARRLRDCSMERDAGWTVQMLQKRGFDAGMMGFDARSHELTLDSEKTRQADSGTGATQPPDL